MGRIIVKARLTNLLHDILHQHGVRAAEPGQLEVEALVDTGASGLQLISSVIRALGLEPAGTVSLRTANGTVQRNRFGAVKLEILGRDGIFSVLDAGEDGPNLIGQIPLEELDFVVDPKSQRLTGNPEHGGQRMSEAYCAPART